MLTPGSSSRLHWQMAIVESFNKLRVNKIASPLNAAANVIIRRYISAINASMNAQSINIIGYKLSLTTNTDKDCIIGIIW